MALNESNTSKRFLEVKFQRSFIRVRFLIGWIGNIMRDFILKRIASLKSFHFLNHEKLPLFWNVRVSDLLQSFYKNFFERERRILFNKIKEKLRRKKIRISILSFFVRKILFVCFEKMTKSFKKILTIDKKT